jgi:hypothetical protein
MTRTSLPACLDGAVKPPTAASLAQVNLMHCFATMRPLIRRPGLNPDQKGSGVPFDKEGRKRYQRGSAHMPGRSGTAVKEVVKSSQHYPARAAQAREITGSNNPPQGQTSPPTGRKPPADRVDSDLGKRRIKLGSGPLQRDAEDGYTIRIARLTDAGRAMRQATQCNGDDCQSGHYFPPSVNSRALISTQCACRSTPRKIVHAGTAQTAHGAVRGAPGSAPWSEGPNPFFAQWWSEVI